MGLLSIKQVEMYSEMITEKFQPIVELLEGRTSGAKDVVSKQAKKDLGVYDLLAERAALTERIEEIDRATNDIIHKQYLTGMGWTCKLDVEIEKRLENMNPLLTEIKNERQALINEIKLSGVSDQVIALFEKLDDRMKVLAEKAGKLPPIKILPAKKSRKRLNAK